MARIIALLGQKGSGKSTVAEMISDSLSDRPFYQPSLASPIKRGAQAMFGIPHEHLYGSSSLRESPIEGLFFDDGLTPITVRYVLQHLGTEFGRRYLGRNIWINLMIRYAASLPEDAVVVITDCRFLNEAEALSKVGAEIWRLQRETRSRFQRFCDAFPILYRIGDFLKLSPHQSEREMWYRSMDKFVTRDFDNRGISLDELKVKVTDTLPTVGLSAGAIPAGSSAA